MKNIYQSLVDYSPVGQDDPTLSSHVSKEFMREGLVIRFEDKTNGVDASLLDSRVLTLSRMVSADKKVSYDFLENGVLISQTMILLDRDKDVEVQYSTQSNTWADAFLTEGKDLERVITQFAVMAVNPPDPDKNIFFNEDMSPSDLPFDGKLYRWTTGTESHEKSEDMAQVMRQSKGILFEDLDQAKVCDMFQITQEELLKLPVLLLQKHALKNG